MSQVEELHVFWHWITMGPYHFARMRALGQRRGIRLVSGETSIADDHEWVRGSEADGLNVVAVGQGNASERTTSYHSVLREIAPDVVVAPGYWDPHFLSAVARYGREREDSLIVLWSESTELDHRRRILIEAVKGQCVSAFDGALVAGSRHAAYLANLGMARNRIGVAGNCVDNQFFDSRARALRAHPGGTRPYFLFVGRFIAEKNLVRLLDAWNQYSDRLGPGAWPLALVGGGPMDEALRDIARRYVTGSITFAGIRQHAELPPYYAGAGCLILPSTSEPWGLVVNEAMASGLPVLVSKLCGCAPDLIQEGANGFTFDPFDTGELASLMERVSRATFPRSAFGEQSTRLISDYTPNAFAERVDLHLRHLRALRRAAPLKKILVRTGAGLLRRL